MGQDTKIEWCHHTLNPWVGCTKIKGARGGPSACDFCYAETWAKRTGHAELWTGERRRTTEANWRQPIKWNASAEIKGERHRVFCASLADVFDNQVPKEWRADLWQLIDATRQLDWLLLTKRPQNIRKMLPPLWGRGWPNVWLGTTTENQKEYDRRFEVLSRVPARVRFISYEPALGPLRLEGEQMPDWVIAGGESGGKARPSDVQWFYDIRDECARFGIPFLFKQHGEWLGGARVGKKMAGRWLEGVQHDGYPA